MNNLWKVLLLYNQFISIICYHVVVRWSTYQVILPEPILGLRYSQGNENRDISVLCGHLHE